MIVPVSEPLVSVTQTAEGLGAGELESAEGSDEFDEGLADDAEEFADFVDEGEAGDDGSAQSAAASADAALRALRVLNVPVTVSVRLAERKMSLGTVVALVPGSLVTFNKSCEALLDLFVNNQRFLSRVRRSRSAKASGLKVSKVGVKTKKNAASGSLKARRPPGLTSQARARSDPALVRARAASSRRAAPSLQGFGAAVQRAVLLVTMRMPW